MGEGRGADWSKDMGGGDGLSIVLFSILVKLFFSKPYFSYFLISDIDMMEDKNLPSCSLCSLLVQKDVQEYAEHL